MSEWIKFFQVNDVTLNKLFLQSVPQHSFFSISFFYGKLEKRVPRGLVVRVLGCRALCWILKSSSVLKQSPARKILTPHAMLPLKFKIKWLVTGNLILYSLIPDFHGNKTFPTLTINGRIWIFTSKNILNVWFVASSVSIKYSCVIC